MLKSLIILSSRFLPAGFSISTTIPQALSYVIWCSMEHGLTKKTLTKTKVTLLKVTSFYLCMLD